ncbi:MAG TPA: universal stress protein [Candidatus Deferrimicrobiaceae bacterium]
MKLLFPVPSETSSDDALRMAIDTAAIHSGKVRLLFVVDEEGIGRLEAGAPPGAIEMAQEAFESLETREIARGLQAIESAKETCLAAGIATDAEVTTGSPHETIGRAAADCDLLVSGIGSRYSFGGIDRPAALALSFMKERTITVLLAASPYRPVRTVAVGCGGGDRTLRAVGAMAKLGLWRAGCRIVLIAVDDDPERAEQKLSGPRKILSDAGYGDLSEVRAPMPKVENFVAACKRESADVAVLGGFGQHRWDDLFGFSITTRMLREAHQHLFLYM